MILYVKCFNCGYVNSLSLDDLLGKYAECVNCQNLIKILENTEPEDEKGRQKKDRNSG